MPIKRKDKATHRYEAPKNSYQREALMRLQCIQCRVDESTCVLAQTDESSIDQWRHDAEGWPICKDRISTTDLFGGERG